jgi:hypothetical protein
MFWDYLGKRGQQKSRKALISMGFTAFLGLPGKLVWWSRGDLNPVRICPLMDYFGQSWCG